jgi:PKD repeat protein
MKIFFPSLFFSVLVCSSLYSQNNLRSELNKTLHAYDITEVHINSLYDQVSTSNKFQVITLTLGGITYELELWDTGMRSENNIVRLASGTSYEGTAPIPLKGYVKNDLGKSVRLTVNENFLYGYIETDKGVLNIEPAWYFDREADKHLIVSYYDTATKKSAQPGTCDLHNHSENLEKDIEAQVRNASRQIGDCYIVDIALAADWLMTDLFGSVGDVDDQICGVLNDVQGNYDDEFLDVVEFDLRDVFISDCSTCDPWTSSTNSGTLLNSFTNWGPSGFSSHDVATLWTARNLNGSTIGVAWLGGTCTGSRYNVCEHFSNNSNLLRVLQAHELGHNFDAEHDNGGGFIMSTSVNNTGTWSADSQLDVENFLPTAGCFGTCSSGSPPTANFSFEVTESCVVGEVEFEDMSGLASEWFWTFEGGTPATSTEQNPIVTYASAGTFDVTLEVINASGEDELEWTDAVEIFDGPVVDFDFDNNELLIFFEDESSFSGNPDYFWDFGDGNTSDEQDPVHSYAAPGDYTVILEVEDDCGFGELILDIEVFDNPIANFTADNLEICRNDAVTYTDLSYGNIEEWDWSFDGAVPNSSTTQNPTVVYNIAGTYSTSLEVENIEGDDDITFENYITVLADAEAGFNFTTNGASVTFTSTSINGTSFVWDFGDGNTSTDQNPTHTYTSSGSYTVLLTVSNQCNTDMRTREVTIELQPVAAFGTSQSTTGCADYTINFTDNSTSNPTAWNWSFPGGTPATSTLQNPTVTYTQRGIYSVSLTSSNSFGSSTASMEDLVTINDVPELTASFTENLLSVQFNSTANFADNIAWNFGDGNTSTLASPTHTYAAAGNYTATVTATNVCGSVSQEFNLNVDLLPSANITANVTAICEGETVTYSNNSSSNITEWNWIFPGGTPATSTQPNPTVTYSTAGSYGATLSVSNAAGQGNGSVTDFINVTAVPDASFTFDQRDNLLELVNTTAGTSVEWTISDGTTSNLQAWTHTFMDNGTYTVTVTTTNQCGSDTESFSVSVNAFPSAGFTTSQTTGCTPLEVNYTSTSTNATNHNWSFPGGTPSSSTEVNPVVIYNTEGTFDATLTVSNTVSSDATTQTQLISVASLQPLTFDSQQNGNVIQLSNTTPNTQTAWTISDGATSTQPNFTHTFQENGTYEVTLLVSNPCGSEETTFTVVVDALPTVRFTADQTSGCTPLQVAFSSETTNASTINWAFPGGTPATSTEANPVVTYNTDGVYDVTLTVGNTFGSEVAVMSQLISVASIAPLTFDSNQNNNVLSLSNTTPNTQTLWTISDGTTSTDPSYTHTFNTNGTFQVTLLVSNACGSEETSFEVVVNNLPEVGFEITSDTEGCAPLVVTYQSNAVNADNHNWSFPGGEPATSTEVNPTVVYTTAGIFDINLQVSNAFGTVQDNRAGLIRVSDVPSASISEVNIEMGDVAFTSEILGATSLLWNFGDGNTSTEDNPSHTYDTPGTYTVTLEATNQCGTFTVETSVFIDIASDVDDLATIDAWRLAPNPSSGLVNLIFDGPTTEDLSYEVLDLSGRKLFSKNLARGINKDELSLEQPGVYLFVITQNSSREVRRLIIMQ